MTDRNIGYEARCLSLCERIREHCQAQGWYGPDGDLSWPADRFEHVRFYRGDYDGPFPDEEELCTLKLRGCPFEWTCDPESGMYEMIIDREHDPVRTRFEHPPATEEQLCTTEKALGYELPGALRALYRELANGGFGPDYGITGVKGGWVFNEDGRHETLDQWRGWEANGPHAQGPHAQIISLTEYDRDSAARFELDLPGNLNPASLVPVCYMGYGADMCVDLETSRVYYANCGGTKDTDGNWSLYIRRIALSVEEWLDLWLHDNTHHKVLRNETI